MARTVIEVCTTKAEADAIAGSAPHPSKIIRVGPTNQLKIVGLGLEKPLFQSGEEKDYFVVIYTPDLVSGPTDSRP